MLLVRALAACAGTVVNGDAGSEDASTTDAKTDAKADAGAGDANTSDATTSDGGDASTGDATAGDASASDASDASTSDASSDASDASSIDASAVDQDLLVYWKLDEGSGTTAADSTGGNNTGTLQTGMTWTTGKLGNALTFNGTTGYVQAANLVQSSVTAYSLGMWFRTTNASQQVLFSNRGVNVTSGKSLTLEMSQSGASGHLQWLLDQDAWGIGVQSTATYNDGAWHYVVATWEAPASTAIDYSQFKIYVDGAGPVGVTNFIINCNCGGVTSPLNGAQGAQIGTSSSWQIYFNGSLDEVGAWNRALSSSDVTLLYNGGIGLSLP